MTERTTRPCVFPTCRDEDDNRRMTRDVICDSCRRRYGRLLEWIGWDFVTIHTLMPIPASTGGPKTRAPGLRTFGHPRAWASGKLSEIADTLTQWEGALRSHLGHGYPVDRYVGEPRRVALSLEYLQARFEALCFFPHAEATAVALSDVHAGVRAALRGASRFQHLPVPCQECEDIALFRETVLGDEDRIKCHSCQAEIPVALYPSYTRTLLNEVLDQTVTETDTCA